MGEREPMAEPQRPQEVLGVCLALSLGHTMTAPFAKPPQAGPNTIRIAEEVLRALAVRGWKLVDTNDGGDDAGR